MVGFVSRALEPALLLDHRAVRRFDIAAALIAALFVALGMLVAVQLWALSRLSSSLFDASSALDQAGQGLSMVRVLPLIGDEVARLADSIRATATSVHAEAVRVRSNIRVLAVVVGVAVALVGLVPLALVYLPFRILRMRALAKLAGRLEGPADPMLVEELAWCALARLPFEELRLVTRSPWRDLDEGRHQRLAEAELRRLGIRPPENWAGPGAGPAQHPRS
ncbi:hypothetical protein [Saccharopolyspora erythraea]|uniref:hypothetical protein n=1 Tax=Saccharopolyspora erythraea TaxID=1836 RepID=UPI002012BFED|nr:hypothetical protein [Saccharopolyspora erythraea]